MIPINKAYPYSYKWTVYSSITEKHQKTGLISASAIGELYFTCRTFSDFRAKLYKYTLKHPKEGDMTFQQLETLLLMWLNLIPTNREWIRLRLCLTSNGLDGLPWLMMFSLGSQGIPPKNSWFWSQRGHRSPLQDKSFV